MSQPAASKVAHWMYRCQKCFQLVSAGIPANKVVVEKRKKKYLYRIRANVGYELKRETRKSRDGKEEVVYIKRRSNKPQHRINDSGGVGFETVRELTVCSDCAKEQRG